MASCGAPERRHVAGNLPVVAVLGVGRVEVGRVVEAGARQRDERRVNDVGAGAAFVGELELALRVLRFPDRVATDAAVVGEVIHVRVGAIDLAGRVDDERLQARIVGALAVVIQVAALKRVVSRDRAGEFDFTALIEIIRSQLDAGLRQVDRYFNLLITAGGEEPQAIADDRTAESTFVDALQIVGILGGVLGGTAAGVGGRFLERRLHRPRRVQQVHAPAARERVAAALGHRVDDAAAESAVLGRDARGQHRGFLDGVLNEQVLRLREQVVVDVDAVDHEHVVPCEGAIDDDLPGIGRPLGHVGRERRYALDGARRRERDDFFLANVGANGRCGDHRRRFRDDLDRLRQRARRQRHVLRDLQAHGHRRRLLDRRKAAQFKCHVVLAGGQCRQRVIAFTVADGRTRALKGRRGGGDGHSGNCQSLLVLNRSADGAGLDALSTGRHLEAA